MQTKNSYMCDLIISTHPAVENGQTVLGYNIFLLMLLLTAPEELKDNTIMFFSTCGFSKPSNIIKRCLAEFVWSLSHVRFSLLLHTPILFFWCHFQPRQLNCAQASNSSRPTDSKVTFFFLLFGLQIKPLISGTVLFVGSCRIKSRNMCALIDFSPVWPSKHYLFLKITTLISESEKFISKKKKKCTHRPTYF